MLRSIEQYLRSTVLPESVMDNVERIANRIVVSVLKNGPIPHHMAFIMDGNRRYAKKGAMAKIEGHALGFNTLKKPD
ncbi:hypothetical protein SARC_00513 [Sphaeroforma arctica JP610]|uniref:Uncharacterized protein n=1 Tax=Sphaeroforma arctica JP610 TaxID=667725 RepID=A0A0L0GEC0_9EUKA|nr:hypothetical protein SARC_00513 [Sphaeroforma arctica JP610]KNC87372.1 hypothetical protein SARC_00513 [Sphaeroforma arctica JP610]|eukprot:XP_014161274.1 hypothetical protein SARC_00513 [Sphaeroforma arctica JP610]